MLSKLPHLWLDDNDCLIDLDIITLKSITQLLTQLLPDSEKGIDETQRLTKACDLLNKYNINIQQFEEILKKSMAFFEALENTGLWHITTVVDTILEQKIAGIEECEKMGLFGEYS